MSKISCDTINKKHIFTKALGITVLMFLMLVGIAGALPFAYIPTSTGGPSTGVVTVVDTTTNNIISNISIGAYGAGVSFSPDGMNVYVGLRDGNLSVINTSTNKVTAKVKIGGEPSGVAVSPNGNRVYVANVGLSTVSVINTTTNKVGATVKGLVYPGGLEVSPDGTKVYVETGEATLSL